MSIHQAYSRAARCLLVLVLVGAGGLAQANCSAFPVLGQLVTIWKRSEIRGAFSPEDAAEARKILDQIVFRDIQRRLEQTGNGQEVPDAMLFISDMSVLTSTVEAGQTTRAAALMDNPLRSDRVRRLDLLNRADCISTPFDFGPEPSASDTLFGTVGVADADSANLDHNRVPRSEKKELRLARVSNPAATSDAKADDADLRGLFLVMFGLLFLMALVLVIHLVMVWVRIKRRHRKICEVPGRLTVSLSEMPGHVVMLSKLGCTFVPNKLPDEDSLGLMGAGTYCTLHVDGQEISAKLVRDISDSVGMIFAQPLDLPILKAIFKLSLIPPKYDVLGDSAVSERQFKLGFGKLGVADVPPRTPKPARRKDTPESDAKDASKNQAA